MGLFSGCLLVSDIDGTLLHDGNIPKRNLEAIEIFKKEGGLFTVATGRAVEAVRWTYKTTGCNAPIIAYNGAAIYDFESEKFVTQYCLTENSKRALKEVFNKFTNIGFEVHSGRKTYVIRDSKGVQWHTEYESLEFDYVNLDDVLHKDWNKVVMAADTIAEMDQLYEYCQSLNDKDGSYIKTLSNNSTNFIELIPCNVDKGRAFLKLAEITGTSDKAFAIGDYYNDIELISASKYGAATIDAPEEVKQIAKFITGSCEDGAVADYIETIGSFLKGSSIWTT